MQRMRQRYGRIALAFAAVPVLWLPVFAEQAVNLSTFGTPGMVDMPTARMLGDGELAFTTTAFGGTRRNTMTFQITPRLQGSFRYTIIDDFDGGRDRYDRSFDLTYLIAEEGARSPAVAVGLRDFGGTGIYSSEFLALTKSFGPKFRVTGGIGWGRLGQRGSFDNPLSLFGDYFDTRPIASKGGIDTTGQVDFDNWFRGPAALFGGLEWMPNDRTRFVLEYSSDEYRVETTHGLIDQKSPLNMAVSYRLKNGMDLELSYLYGTELGFRLTYVLDPRKPSGRSGIEKAPDPIRPREAIAAGTWEVDARGAWRGTGPDRLRTKLEGEGLVFRGMERSGNSMTLYVENARYGAGAQAVGRAARALANTAPADVETFRIVPVHGGIALSEVTLQRRDLEANEFALDGAWESFALAAIDDGHGRTALEPGPILTYGVEPYFEPSFFDPDNPIRADAGIQLNAAYAPVPNLILSGAVRIPVLGNLDDSARPSDSVLPHVRSDFALYDKETEVGISHLTAEYFFRPGENLYGRATVGYLERMYAGVSTEVLWKPVDGRLALGAELNYAVQREFNGGLELQDYDIVTGHASAYYDVGQGYVAQLDVGRYLAGDTGATLTLEREFANGFKVGAFMTFTDVSFDEFGEGSFDKGISLTIPINWITGRASQDQYSTTIRPVLRDGGARLDVRNRLYDLTTGYDQGDLQDDWGRFWR